MSCHHCLNRVQKALAAVPNVQITSVQIGQATLQYDPAEHAPEAIAEAVSKTGYRAQVVAS
jgi:copper chaperone CopZ